MWQPPSQSFGVGKALVNSFQLWRFSLWQLVPFSFLCLIWNILPMFFMEISTRNLAFYILLFRQADPVIAILLLVALFIIFYGVLCIFYGAIYFRMQQFLLGKPASFALSLNVGLKKMPSLLLAAIIITITLGVGTALLIVPGLFLAIILQFYFPILIAEDLGPWVAYKRSFRLVWGNWWHVAIVTLIIGLFTSAIVTVIFYGLERILREPVDYHALIGLLQSPLSTRTFQEFISLTMTEIVVGTLLFPLFVATVFVLLHNLRLRLAQRGAIQDKVEITSSS